jgi:hypothetical protein
MKNAGSYAISTEDCSNGIKAISRNVRRPAKAGRRGPCLPADRKRLTMSETSFAHILSATGVPGKSRPGRGASMTESGAY